MITLNKLSVQFGTEPLFKDVSIKFSKGNCYGIIGANGAGKSTLLKVISGDIESTSGDVNIAKDCRIGILKQNHFEFDEITVLDTVIMGHKELYTIMKEKERLYSKEDFNEEDGIKVAKLETRFADLDGWQAEADAATLLDELGIENEKHYILMKELSGSEKVRVLLAQALFGNPDILLLDEPTNHLDIKTIKWLEQFLINFDNTVLVVSHDRKFLDNVCTHIADIDFCNIQIYPGNYSFWTQASQLILKQKEEQNRKTEEKIEELKSFIARFSANASKAKQATSRKNILDKLTLEDIKPSSRKYPRIRFNYVKIPGKEVITVENLSKKIDENLSIRDFNMDVQQGEKIAFLSPYPNLVSNLFKLFANELSADSGNIKWGVTATYSYFPKDFNNYFQTNINLIDWLRQYSKDQHINYIRGYLGRMLFSGEDSEKASNVLSGGEKVRCMLAKMMVEESNVLILDEPTNHLDLEAITALNNSLIDFSGTIFFTSQDHQFIQTIADRIIEVTPNGMMSFRNTYEEFLENPQIQKRRQKLYKDLVLS